MAARRVVMSRARTVNLSCALLEEIEAFTLLDTSRTVSGLTERYMSLACRKEEQPTLRWALAGKAALGKLTVFTSTGGVEN